ncbi:MAG: hypothetical protein CVU17_07935 [Betaproteobacteria bacterium HGW-Betaproteobacteria-11]|nr:MAG: hypothetical protein CVU17_07935 [Betaproteobacteria bacterium HGW-Betaproteobacteria-11]
MSSRADKNSALATRQNPWLAGSLWLSAFLLWLLNHPYQGIWHDARIYGLIAAHWIYPEALANDVFFRFGSQADLSLFTPLYGELVRALGLDAAARLVVLSGAAGWVTAWVLFAHAVLGESLAGRFAVLFAAVVTVSYSPNGGVFMLDENFATARSWALPCGLLAIAFELKGYRRWASGLALLAFLLHPLLGIWPLMLFASGYLPLRLLPWLALLPALATAIVGACGAFDGIAVSGLRLFDGAILEFIHNAPDIMFKPGASRLSNHVLPLVLLLLGARAGTVALRPWYLRLFYLGGGALALAWMSVVFPLEIVVQGQPWRVTWLTLPIAGVALLDVLQTLHRASPERLAVPWLCAVLLALVTLGTGVTPWLWPALGVITLALSFLPARFYITVAQGVHRWRRGALACAIILWVVALPGLWTELEIFGARFIGAWWPDANVLHGLVAGGSWLFPFLLAIVLGVLARWRAATFAALVLLAATAGLTLSAWDWRSAPRRAEEARWLAPRQPSHPFVRFIQPGAVVAWPERETAVWFELHAASYAGEIQRTGIMFSKEKFALLNRRSQALQKVTDHRELCRDLELDWVVERTPASGVMPVTQLQDWGLYPCHEY